MKSNGKILLGVISILSGIIFLCLAISFSYDGPIVVFTGSYSLMALVTGISIIVKVAKQKKKEELAQEEKRRKEAAEQEEKRRQEERNKPIKFYNDCEKRNIRSVNTEAEKQGLMLIAKKYGITGFEEALSVFRQGKDHAEKEELKKRRDTEKAEQREAAKKLQLLRSKDYETIIEQKRIAMLRGVKKYTDYIDKQLDAAKRRYDDAEKEIEERSRRSANLAAFSSLATSVYSYEKPVQEENWAIHGGIANAIAGPAAGLATAMDVQRRNAEAKEEAARDRQRRAKELNSVQSAISSAQRKASAGASDVYKDRESAQKSMNDLNKELDIILDKLIDEKDTEKKFEMLTFNNFTCSLTDAGNIEVTCTAKLNENVHIATTEGWLDGSVKLTVLDSNNTPVACGYYAGKYLLLILHPSKQEKDLPSVTFGCRIGNYTQISALCATFTGKTVTSTEGLYVQVEPVHMWIIEK